MKMVKLQRHRLVPIFFTYCFILFSSADILPGSILYASNSNQAWSSPNSSFSLRFISCSPSSSSSSCFFAAITYAGGIPVWTCGGSSAAVDSSASLQFLADGNLRLLNGSSGEVVWESGTGGRGVTAAVLHDSGNLVLLRNGSSVPVWSSFNYPTDTILPSQNFTVKQVLRSGLYSFSLLKTGNLTLKWNNFIIYWNLGTYSSNNLSFTSPTLHLQSIGTLSIFDSSLLASVIMAYCSDYGEGNDILRFLRLDNDGNLRIYSSARGSGRTNVSWVAVSDQCKVFGYCGNMGICSYKGLSPICECASKNFDPVDPTDGRKGCKRKMELEECPQSQIMLQLNHTLFLTYPPELSNQSQLFYGNLIACMSNCLLSPPCTASTALGDNSGTIFMKLSNFAGGYRSPALPSTSFVKICGPAIPNPPFSSLGARASRLPAWNVGVVVVGTIVCFIALQGGLIWWCCYRRRNGKLRGRSVALLKYGSGRTVEFSYKDLQYVTKGFKEKLGAGEFGAAYRGALASGTTVAVKQLEGIKQGERQFRREITSLICTHHLNLVRLIGFCAEGRHRILVYEFMKNGSLENSLFTTEEEKSRKWLNWGQRFNIAIGTARAITYLHEECEHRILHYDIKPGNILLDEHYNPIVSDFCLAELINPINRCQKLTNSAGSRGYVAPEWLENMQMTSKSDVYSFGMVLLEIVSGRRSYQVSHETNGKTVSLWAYEEFEKGNAKGIMDRRIADCEELDMEQVRRVIQVSFWCIQREPCRRPTMGKVVQMLEGVSKIEKPPAPHVSSNIRASSLLGDPTMATSSFSFQTRRGLSVGSARNPEREDSFVL